MQEHDLASDRTPGRTSTSGALDTIYAAHLHTRPTACALVDLQGG